MSSPYCASPLDAWRGGRKNPTKKEIRAAQLNFERALLNTKSEVINIPKLVVEDLEEGEEAGGGRGGKKPKSSS
jgi:hypothetical protein